jgi:RNA polymerase sigma-70 factor (ECF subfamily)
MSDITDALNMIAAGGSPPDPAVGRIYAELRAISSRHLRRNLNSSLQVTELMHEAFVKLFRPGQKPWESRAHFFGSAARAMQQVLIDHWDEAGRCPVMGSHPLEGHVASVVPSQTDPRPVIAALEQLQALHPEMAEIVRLRCFAGQSVEAVAEMLGCSTRSVKRHYAMAEQWLYAKLHTPP